MTVADIKSWNGLKKNKISRGKTLKIHTYERIPKPKSEQVAEAASKVQDVAESVDSVSGVESKSVAVKEVAEEKPKVVKEEKKAKTSKAKKEPQYTRYKVRKGDTLSKISRRYGVTVEQIQRASGLKSTKLSIGQTLKIPKKK